MRKRIIVGVLVAALVGGPWIPATAWSKGDRLSRVHAYTGQLAWVLLRSDQQLLVRVVDAADAELMVTVGGIPRTIGVSDIARVWVDGDSVKDGAIIGGLVGLPLGLLSAQGASSGEAVPGYAVFGMFFYGAIGALIDWRHHGRTILYQAPGS